MAELYSLVCTKGQYEGARFPINGYISIGRDPRRCQLLLPDAPDVSPLHCEIKVGPFGVTLTDIGSAKGTCVFGRKLLPGETVMLGNGDIFYIADGDNTFMLIAEQPEPTPPPPLPQSRPLIPPIPPRYAKPIVIALVGVLSVVAIIVAVAVIVSNRSEFPDTSERTEPESSETEGTQSTDDSSPSGLFPQLSNGLIGKWQLTSYGYKIEEGGGLGEPVKDGFIIEFRNDGVYAGTYNGRYAVNGETVTIGGTEYRFEIPDDNADRLILSYDYYEETSCGTIIEASMLFDRIS